MGDEIGTWLKEAEDRRKILALLLPALKAAEGMGELESLEYIPGKEMAVAGFADGKKVGINVAGDSDMAMIYDVVVKLWRPR